MGDTEIFKNKLFCVLGTFLGQTHSDIAKKITQYGGKCKNFVTQDTDFVITTNPLVTTRSRIAAAQKWKIPFRTLIWLEDCISSGKLIGERELDTTHCITLSRTVDDCIDLRLLPQELIRIEIFKHLMKYNKNCVLHHQKFLGS